MSEQVFEKIRSEVAMLLAKPTDALDAKGLYDFIQEAIEGEREMRNQARGGGSTLVLNGLLAAKLDMRIKVFGLPPEVIKSPF